MHWSHSRKGVRLMHCIKHHKQAFLVKDVRPAHKDQRTGPTGDGGGRHGQLLGHVLQCARRSTGSSRTSHPPQERTDAEGRPEDCLWCAVWCGVGERGQWTIATEACASARCAVLAVCAGVRDGDPVDECECGCGWQMGAGD